MKRMLAGAVALAATIFTGSFTLIPAAYAAPAAPTAPPPEPDTVAFHISVAQPLPAHAVLPLWHTVQAGETLSGLAVTYCKGTASDWTGFYAENKKVIGADPNLIYPGQRLNLSRCTDPPQLLHLGSTYHAPARVTVTTSHASTSHASTGKVWGVTQGYPNWCGDGDGDGWDVKCVTTHTATAPASSSQRVSAAHRAYNSSYRGTYSYQGLEDLWIAAGGPAWAAAHAAEIAMCESGGNPGAYNPSGATGLWQILGSVVPGNLYNPYVNALNAVSKFRASGENFSQWVCR